MTLFNHLSSLLPAIVSPLGISLLLLFAALLSTGRTRRCRLLLGVGLSVLIIFSLPLTSKQLIASLEHRYPALAMNAIPRAELVILLGGSLNRPISGLTRPELGPSGDRLALTAALWHAGKTARILISAGGLVEHDGVASEAVHTVDVLASWGVPREAMLIEGDSGNTFENARFSRRLLDTDTAPAEARTDDDSITLLVTSALHMPRARALFCRAGIDTIGVTANHWLNGSTDITLSNWYPQATALRGSSQALREYLGIVVYWLLGRLDADTLAHDQACVSSQA